MARFPRACIPSAVEHPEQCRRSRRAGDAVAGPGTVRERTHPAGQPMRARRPLNRRIDAGTPLPRKPGVGRRALRRADRHHRHIHCERTAARQPAPGLMTCSGDGRRYPTSAAGLRVFANVGHRDSAQLMPAGEPIDLGSLRHSRGHFLADQPAHHSRSRQAHEERKSDRCIHIAATDTRAQRDNVAWCLADLMFPGLLSPFSGSDINVWSVRNCSAVQHLSCADNLPS